jgi:hypothetical protein
MSVAEAHRFEVVRRAGPHIAGGALTYAWLALLFVTTRIQRSAPRRKRQRLLREQSTNIAQLQRKPLHVPATASHSWWGFLFRSGTGGRRSTSVILDN